MEKVSAEREMAETHLAPVARQEMNRIKSVTRPRSHHIEKPSRARRRGRALMEC